MTWPDTLSCVSTRTAAYPIHVAHAELEALELLSGHIGDRGIAIITDETVDALHAKRIGDGLAETGRTVRKIVISPGESSKTLATVWQLLSWLSQTDFQRRDVLVAIGGGVVIDTAGFVASMYMRGVPYVNVPTTLLAQVDAAIGGKVGVDFGVAKNLVGAFYEPLAVISCVAHLSTLDERQLRSGLAEVIKKAVIASPDTFSYLESRLDRLLGMAPADLHTLVSSASAVKSTLIGLDPYEKDLYRPLNFGHTVGHAVETATGYGPVLHGEAVAFGMAVAVRIAVRRRVLDPRVGVRITMLLRAAGLPVAYADLAVAPPVDDVLSALEKIRQVRGGSLRFVLPTRIGDTLIIDDATPTEIGAAMVDPGTP